MKTTCNENVRNVCIHTTLHDNKAADEARPRATAVHREIRGRILRPRRRHLHVDLVPEPAVLPPSPQPRCTLKAKAGEKVSHSVLYTLYSVEKCRTNPASCLKGSKSVFYILYTRSPAFNGLQTAWVAALGRTVCVGASALARPTGIPPRPRKARRACLKRRFLTRSSV